MRLLKEQLEAIERELPAIAYDKGYYIDSKLSKALLNLYKKKIYTKGQDKVEVFLDIARSCLKWVSPSEKKSRAYMDYDWFRSDRWDFWFKSNGYFFFTR